MKAKLIKVNDNQLDGGFYILRDLNGNPIGLEGNLSLKNCQAIERGFDLDELAKTEYPISEVWNDEEALIRELAFKKGFQKAIELMGHKKFSEKDVRKAIDIARNGSMQEQHNGYGRPTELRFVLDNTSSDEIIQSLQQTEWDVTILMEKDEPKSFVKRKVIRKLDNGEEIEWTCFWDNGWFSAVGIKIPNVISWERLPILDADGCLILKHIK